MQQQLIFYINYAGVCDYLKKDLKSDVYLMCYLEYAAVETPSFYPDVFKEAADAVLYEVLRLTQDDIILEQAPYICMLLLDIFS